MAPAKLPGNCKAMSLFGSGKLHGPTEQPGHLMDTIDTLAACGSKRNKLDASIWELSAATSVLSVLSVLLPNNTGQAVTQAILAYIRGTLVSPLLGCTWIAEVERSDKCDNELRRVQETRKRFTPAISFPPSLECGKSF